MEAEGVAPVEGAVVQQIEPGRLGRLVSAHVDLEQVQRGQHRQHAHQRVQVQAAPLRQLGRRGRATGLERLEQPHFVGCGDGRHPVGRKPHIPDDPVVPDRRLNALSRHTPLRLFARAAKAGAR